MSLEVLINTIKPAITPLLLPPVPFIFLALLGLVLIWRHQRRAGLLTMLTALLCLWIGGTEVAADTLLTHLLTPPKALSAERIESLTRDQRNGLRTAVLVLGGGINIDVA